MRTKYFYFVLSLLLIISKDISPTMADKSTSIAPTTSSDDIDLSIIQLIEMGPLLKSTLEALLVFGKSVHVLMRDNLDLLGLVVPFFRPAYNDLTRLLILMTSVLKFLQEFSFLF